MAIKALIFDLGGVLLDIDWEKYREDTGQEVPIQNFWPIGYEKMNTELLQFLVNMRPLYKIAILSNGGLREAMNRKFRLGELVDLHPYIFSPISALSDGMASSMGVFLC